MPKQLRNYPIYLAPKIVGRISRNSKNEVFDEKICEILDQTNTDDDNSQIIDFSENETIKINYRMFLHKIRIDFNRYLKILINAENINERNNFNRMLSNLVNM